MQEDFLRNSYIFTKGNLSTVYDQAKLKVFVFHTKANKFLFGHEVTCAQTRVLVQSQQPFDKIHQNISWTDIGREK